MDLVSSLVMLSFVLFKANGYPHPVYTSHGNVDTWLQGDESRGGMILRRSYDPSNSPRVVRGGQTTYTLRQPEGELYPQQFSQYHLADRRRQALLEVNDTPPQENEVYYNNPQIPQTQEISAGVTKDVPELIEPTERTEVPTTKAVVVPEFVEPEINEETQVPVETSRKAVNKKKQPKKPVGDEEEDYEDYSYKKFASGAFFPMFFGWGGSSGGNGPTAIANAFSTGKGGAAASDAIAYAHPRPIGKV